MNFVANYTCEDFIRRQVGMVTEVLTEYGKLSSNCRLSTAVHHFVSRFPNEGRVIRWDRPSQSLLV